MMTVTRIVGSASEPAIAERLHELEHRNRLEILVIDRADASRRRLRGKTDKGTDIAVALGRDDKLSDGTVILLEADRAVVVRMNEERWLQLVARDADAALQAGYCAGNHHWRVRFVPGALLVALQGPAEHYLSRLEELTRDGRIRVAIDE
ncbi:MAG: urease accessory protein UreE [Rhizobiales bacterium]|nr:urease accessory protein UreE [Hyphomicrobiales bacterium]